jgi:hypothetical protein
VKRKVLRAGAALVAVAAVAAAGASSASAAVSSGHVRARAAANPAAITTQPRLVPAFDPAVPNYVTRCEPRERVSVSVTTGGQAVSVDRQAFRSGRFTRKVRLVAGQRFTLRTRAGAGTRTYDVRCLPINFPRFTVRTSGQAQAAYYLITPSSSTSAAQGPPYVALFDRNGVPVWWYQEVNGIPTNASLGANGTLLWSITNGNGAFGYPSGPSLEQHRLNGQLLHAPPAGFTDTDLEAIRLANGDFVTTGYALRKHVVINATGDTAPVLDGTFQEMLPDGTPVFSWNAANELSVSESERWWFAWGSVPRSTTAVWDLQHVDSVATDGDGYVVSMRNDDAIYLISRSTGAVEWKLGGTPTPQSLTIVGDPLAASDFGGQNDARVLPDATISVLDNGTYSGPWLSSLAPRVLRFRIDPQARTATLIQTLTDPAVKRSACCGSARALPGGDWVVDWGAAGVVEELAPNSTPVLRLTFASPTFSYRAVPILPGQLSAARIQAGMDKMYPRRVPRS